MTRLGCALTAIGALAIAIGLANALRTSPPLNARVSMKGGELIVTNEDHQDWRNVRLEVNERFNCHIGLIEESKPGTVLLASCLSDDGTRFNIFTSAPKNVRVAPSLWTTPAKPQVLSRLSDDPSSNWETGLAWEALGVWRRHFDA